MLRGLLFLFALLGALQRPARGDALAELASWPLLLEEQELPPPPAPSAHPLLRARAHRLRGAYGDAQAALDGAGPQAQGLALLAERRLLEIDRWTDPLLRSLPSDDWACAQSGAQAEYERRVSALEQAGADPRAQVLALWARQLGTLRTGLTPQQLGASHAALEQRARRTLELSGSTGLLGPERRQALHGSLFGEAGWFAAARRDAAQEPAGPLPRRGDLRRLRRALGAQVLQRVQAGDAAGAQRLFAELRPQLAAHRDAGLALWLGRRYQQAAVELAQGALRFAEARQLWQLTRELYQAAQLPVAAAALAVQVAETLIQAGAVLQARDWLTTEPPQRCEEEGVVLPLRSDLLISRMRALVLLEDLRGYQAARAAAQQHAVALEQALGAAGLDEVDRQSLQARRGELRDHLRLGGVWLSFHELREALVLDPQLQAQALVERAQGLAQRHGLDAELVRAFILAPLLGDRGPAQRALARGQRLVPLPQKEALVRYGAFAQALPLVQDARAPADVALLAEVRLGLGQPAAALALSRQVITRLESARGALFDERVRGSYLNQHRFQLVYETAVRAAAQAGDAEALFASIEGGRAAGLRERLVRRARGAFVEEEELAQAILYDEALAAEHRCGEGAAPAGRCDTLRQELARLHARYDARLRAHPQHALLAPPPPPLAAVQARLPAQRLLLDYFVTADEVVLLAIDRAGARIFTRAALRVQLEGRTLRLLQALSSGQEDAEDARWLAERLLPEPLRAQLAAGPERELVIAAHGLLHEVPFAYLPLAGAPLVRRHTLAQVPALLASAAGSALAPPREGAVLVHASPAEPLPLALEEARQVAALYAQGGRVQADATPTDVLQALERPQVVHVVAHGSAQPQRSESRLVLRGGPLDVAEVLLWPRALRAPLLVLSACELGIGRRALDDERVGLPRSLVLRGVGAVVASLWQLPEGPALLALMRALHQGLQRHPPARALALAQRAALGHNTSPDTWAALTLLEAPGASSRSP